MNPGLLDRQFTFESKTLTRDTFGQEVASWATDFTTWGQLIEMAGVERFEAAQLTEKADVKIIIRYRTGVTTKLRCFDVLDSRYYEIVNVKRIGRNNTFELLGKLILRT